jgi:hypothetical protein
MKTRLLSLLLIILTTTGFAQTATNFTIKDCAGTMHDLFSELDSGKVVVLNWVMPCGACVPTSLTTFNVVESYQSTNPNTVRYYLCDDLANTSCTSLNSWAKGNHITPRVAFSDTAIKMLDYGTQAMPKVVVLGGGNHHIFRIFDAVLEAADLQASIDAALTTAGIPENTKGNSWALICPNPANDGAVLTISTEKPIHVKAELFNILSRKIETLYDGTHLQGESKTSIDLSQYIAGVYFIRVSDSGNTRIIKLTVNH